MKKYLLLLVLALSTTPCFAQQLQPVTTQEDQTEEEKEINDVLIQIKGLEFSVSKIIEDYSRFIDEGNIFVIPYIDQLDVLWSYEIKRDFLDVYYPNNQYVGGLTPEIAHQKYYEYQDRINELVIQIETSCKMYFINFVPFNTEYADVRTLLDELAANVDEYSIKIKDNYNKAIESLKVAFDTLFEAAEAAMYSLSMDGTYLERVSALRTGEDNLALCAETATDIEKSFNTAKETIESECPDVKEHYLSRLDNEEKEYNHIIRYYPLEKGIFDQEQTDSHIKSLNESADKVKVIVEEAKAAQERYKLCSDALAEATAEIDAIQNTVQNDCPDVWTDYSEEWDRLRKTLKNLADEIDDAVLNDNSTNDLRNALNNLINKAKEISDKAHAAQQGVTGIDSVEAAGNTTVH